jgi:hypothetical protein
MRSLFARAFPAPARVVAVCRRREPLDVPPLLELLEPRQLLSTYYVSPWGNDRSSGTSQNAAWRTVQRVNNQTLHAGDTILFKGNNTFNGSIQVLANEGGSATSAVTFGSYGGGKATISSGGSAGLDVGQTAGIHVNNLIFRGNGMYSNSANGIWFHANWSNKNLSNIDIEQVEVTGYGGYDIKLEAPGYNSSFSNVRIVGGLLHDSRTGGIWINAWKHEANKNIYIAWTWVWNHPGTGATNQVTGNGICVFDTDNATVERCVVHDNGSSGAAPVGIWTSGSNRVTFQYNESFNNKTKTGTDGGGFDFDWDVTNSTMQYNYSHDNYGPGFLIAAGSHTCDSNTIRYNVSQNDARRNGRGAVELWGRVTNTKLYNNTIYVGSGASGGASALFAHNYGAGGQNMYNLDVRNNIFYTTSGYTLVRVNSAVTTSSSNHFIGNDYYSGGSTFRIDWNGSAYSSLSAWQNAKGQEKLNGWNTGYMGDPKLNAPGKAGALNYPSMSALWQYKLQSSSPLINRGQNPLTTLSSATHDFFGGWLPRSSKYDIGADEAG